MIMIAVNLMIKVIIITNVCGNKNNNKRGCKNIGNDNDNNSNNYNNNNIKASKTVMVEVVKGDELSLSKKYLRSPEQYIASDNQVQLLAFPWQSCLELTGEGIKGK